ncbi:uncharacterized protein LOC115599880 [Calypte anna]|uniref:uncharacterized protein LOC115599880 n=1 Tax=Calypte anna TaxID=9244 RepID=UPI0011C46F26|nr:uncharacterized protein LOC115599880 [Calypte anna]
MSWRTSPFLKVSIYEIGEGALSETVSSILTDQPHFISTARHLDTSLMDFMASQCGAVTVCVSCPCYHIQAVLDVYFFLRFVLTELWECGDIPVNCIPVFKKGKKEEDPGYYRLQLLKQQSHGAIAQHNWEHQELGKDPRSLTSLSHKNRITFTFRKWRRGCEAARWVPCALARLPGTGLPAKAVFGCPRPVADTPAPTAGTGAWSSPWGSRAGKSLRMLHTRLRMPGTEQVL